MCHNVIFAVHEIEMKEPKASPKDWIAKGEANMNESEVLFCALLLIKSTEKVPKGRDDLSKWSSAVLCEEKHATELQAAWTPPEDKRIPHGLFRAARVRLQEAQMASP